MHRARGRPGGDAMTMPAIADTFSRVIGRQVDYVQVPWEGFEEQMGEEYTVMYRWFNDYGYEADIAALREENPGLISFEQYLRATVGRTQRFPLRPARRADSRGRPEPRVTVPWECERAAPTPSFRPRAFISARMLWRS